jgi:hypothetical protein
MHLAEGGDGLFSHGVGARLDVGSWLCENARSTIAIEEVIRPRRLEMPTRKRTQLRTEPRNIILVALRFFEFLHSQGHLQTSASLGACPLCPRKRTSEARAAMSALDQYVTLAELLDHLVGEREQ